MELPSSFQFSAGLVALILLSTLWLAKETKSGTNTKQAPEPSGALPVIGHLHLLMGPKPLFRVLGDMADKHGPTFMLRLGINRVLVVSTSEAAKECFTTNDKALASRPRYAIGEYLGYHHALLGISPYSPYWREVRKLATLELLSNRQLELLKHVRAAEVDSCMKELYESWEKNGKRPVQIEMKQQLGDLMFNIAVMMITGKRYFGRNVTEGDEGEARQFRNAMIELFHLAGMFVLSDSIPFLKWLDLGGNISRMKKTAKELDSLKNKGFLGNNSVVFSFIHQQDSMLMGWLEEHRRMRICGDVVVEGREDFIHVMLSTLKDAKLSDYDHDTIIKALSLALILAGTDTTAATLTWALSLLLNNPGVLKKAQDESDNHVGKERNVEESDIQNLVYLQAIIKETMRLYPAAPLAIPHQAMESCYINGYYVPAGTWLIPNLWKVQRDPRMWSDPKEFRPERFLTSHSNIDFKGQHFEYIPFGSGRRSCPGISFATQVMHLTLARLLHGFDVVSPLGEPVDMSEGLGMTMPKMIPLEVLITPRLPSKLYE